MEENERHVAAGIQGAILSRVEEKLDTMTERQLQLLERDARIQASLEALQERQADFVTKNELSYVKRELGEKEDKQRINALEKRIENAASRELVRSLGSKIETNAKLLYAVAVGILAQALAVIWLFLSGK